MILQNASVPEHFLHEQPNKNLRGGGEGYFWELDHLGLNFAGWSCCLFTKNIGILGLCFMFCSIWRLFKINTRFSPSLPLLMRLAVIHTTLFLSVDFLVCHKAECLHPDSASWRHLFSAQRRVTVPEGMKSILQYFPGSLWVWFCSVGFRATSLPLSKEDRTKIMVRKKVLVVTKG